MTPEDPLVSQEGETLADSSTSTAPRLPPEEAASGCVATLIVQSGANLGDYYVFPRDKDAITVGRARDTDFRISDTSVSRHHVRFREVPADGGVPETRVQDLGSTNGTLVRGDLIDEEVALQDGDVLQVGDIALRFRRMDPTDRAFQEEIAAKIENARTDPLTGLQTRRFLDDHLPDLAKAHVRNARPISLLMVDLDSFKQVNDSYGHIMGDQVLHEVAQLIQSAIRGGDTAVRYGGEEFCIVLPGASEQVATRVAERIRGWTESEGASRSETVPWVTVSVGVATLAEGEEVGRWLERADEALYQAKRGGRNQVIVAPEALLTFEVETMPRSLADRDTRRVPRVPGPDDAQDGDGEDEPDEA